jgi:hypothetical protein
MKHLSIVFFVFAIILFTSCNNDNKKNQISGEWTLSSYNINGEKVELTDCDEKTTWNFTLESAESLGDGTNVHKLNAKAPDNCKYYGFDAPWTIKDGKLFISSSRIGGMGGSSLAGLMDIIEISESKMMLAMMKKELIFTR